jgi:hypothetical protein
MFRKNQLKKSQNPLNLGKNSQNPEKNCRDFLIPKIFVRFFQSNLPLALARSRLTAKSHQLSFTLINFELFQVLTRVQSPGQTRMRVDASSQSQIISRSRF